MGSYNHSVARNHGIVMSPIQSEKRRSRNVTVYSFTWLDVIVVLVSMGTYLADIITDILVTLVYWKLDEKIWAGLTLTFLIVPSIIMQIFSTRWYVADGHKATLSMFFIHLFMMGPIKRYIGVLKYGIRAKKTKRIEDYQAMYSELSDVSMLRLFESFLESAPQLVLQLYIMIKVTEDDHILTGIAAFFSLISLAWAIAAYTKALRTAAYSQDSRKKRVSWSGLALQTLWRVGMVSGRIVALVLFATAYPVWLLAGVGVHWFVMTLWLVIQDTDFCGSWWEERLFNAVVGVIHIFCFFNMKEGRSRCRMLAFYLIAFLENSAMILFWFPERTYGTWYNIPALIVVWGGFAIGLTSMLLYYRYFHPSSPKRCHCCMLYYHILYRCCPCHDVTAFNGTPYKRNVNVEETSSDFEYENSDAKYLYGRYREIGDDWAHEFRTPDDINHPLDGGAENHSIKNERKFLDQSHRERGKKNKLVMPRPKLTSTPGDDLDEKSSRIRDLSPCNHGDLDDDSTVKSSPKSCKNSEAISLSDSAGILAEKEKGLSADELVPMTPLPLKLLPGAHTGPCTNKGNSTLVREWVKKTQDMYNGAGGVQEGDLATSANQSQEFGTLRFAKRDEREFMEMHFGDFRALPSGRRDILRMKSFNKKDREQLQKNPVRKHKRNSHNATDLRNTFREAFGFHAVGTSIEDSGSEAEARVVQKQPRKRRLRKNPNRTWTEIERDGLKDCHVKRNDASENKGKRSASKTRGKRQPVNIIMARIDQPPDLGEVQGKGDFVVKISDKMQKKEAILASDHKLCQPEELEKFITKEVRLKLSANSLGAEVSPTCTGAVQNSKGVNIKYYGPVDQPIAESHDETCKNPEMGEEDDNEHCDAIVICNHGDIANQKRPSNSVWETSELDVRTESEPNARDSTSRKDRVDKDESDKSNQPSKPLIKIKWKKPASDVDMKPVSGEAEKMGFVQNLQKKDGILAPCRGTEPTQRIGSQGVHPELECPNMEDDLEGIQENILPSDAIVAPAVERSVYDNLTASILLEPNNEEYSLAPKLEKNQQNSLPIRVERLQDDKFGPVIQFRGDRVTVKHKDHKRDIPESILNPLSCLTKHQKPRVISNRVPAFHASVIRANLEKAKISSDPEPVKGRDKENIVTQQCAQPSKQTARNGTKLPQVGARRDRVEYLYKIGRQGLKKAAQNSPARKRLSFKKSNLQRSENEPLSSGDFSDDEHALGEESRKNHTGRKSAITATEPHQKQMEKSIEALTTSMEGVINSSDNYTVHIHHEKPLEKTSENSSSRRRKDRGSKPQRRTLGAIENH